MSDQWRGQKKHKCFKNPQNILHKSFFMQECFEALISLVVCCQWSNMDNIVFNIKQLCTSRAGHARGNFRRCYSGGLKLRQGPPLHIRNFFQLTSTHLLSASNMIFRCSTPHRYVGLIITKFCIVTVNTLQTCDNNMLLLNTGLKQKGCKVQWIGRSAK